MICYCNKKHSPFANMFERPMEVLVYDLLAAVQHCYEKSIWDRDLLVALCCAQRNTKKI